MSEHAMSTSARTTDPVGGVGEAFGSAADAMKHGATELQTKFSEALPATGHFMGRLIYNTAYSLSYGLVFPVMVVVRVIPKDNAVVHGLVDGALAARDRIAEWDGELLEEDGHDHETDDALATENGATENGATEHAEASARANYRRPKAKRGGTRKATRSTRKKS